MKLARASLAQAGVLSVDGKELSSQKIEHTIPLMMTIDETFDIGVDTRTGVDDSYQLPFRFTGTIDKLLITPAANGQGVDIEIGEAHDERSEDRRQEKNADHQQCRRDEPPSGALESQCAASRASIQRRFSRI